LWAHTRPLLIFFDTRSFANVPFTVIVLAASAVRLRAPVDGCLCDGAHMEGYSRGNPSGYKIID
jgi:hypothetical protein